jgi:hypothetical protein
VTAPALAAARRALAAGLAPWPPAEDGTKRPAPEPVPAGCEHPDCVAAREKAAADGRIAYGWIHRHHTRADESELSSMYRRGLSGVGLICGAISGGLEMLEFEGRAVDEGLLEEFEAAARTAGLGDVLAYITGGYSERTPSGGVHLLYRCSEVSGNQKLARRPATTDELAADPADKVKVLIETRGEGGYTITAPTNGKVHPCGGAWEQLHGGFDTIFEITPEERAALLALARTFDRTPVVERPKAAPAARLPHEGLRPGDDFNARADWDDVLGPHGWVLAFRRGDVCYWRRPGKDGRGWSATTNYTGRDTLIVFTTSTGFEEWSGSGPAPSYSKFAAYAVLNHGGEFEAAARDLAAQGYGDREHHNDFSDWVDTGRRPLSSIEPTGDDWPTLDSAALYGLAGRVVRKLAPHTEADPAGLLLVFLASFGSAVGRPGPHAFADGCIHPPRLNVALVGDTSRSRKGTTAARVRSVFELADPTWAADRIMSGFGSGEALVDEVRDPEMGVDKDGMPVITKAGVDDKRLCVVEGEFARILAVAAREGSTLSALIRDAWDLGRLAARARHQKSVATGAHVNFVVAITVEELRRRLSEVEVANGLANRFLFCCVRRSQLLPSGGEVDPAVLAALADEVRVALEAARKMTRLSRTASAEKRWAAMYAEMADGPGGLLGAATARAEAQTLRLSVAFALLDGAQAIEEPHLEAAYAVWRYCEASARFIFGDVVGDEVADRLLEAIRAAGGEGLSATEQMGVFSRNVSAARLKLAREELERRKLVVTSEVATGGRPKLVTIAVQTKKEERTSPWGYQRGEGAS